MILPHTSFSNGKAKGVDLSALGYWSDQIWPEPVERIVNRESLDIKIEKQEKSFRDLGNKDKKNYFFTNSEINSVIQGFSDGLEKIKEQSLNIVSCLKLYAEKQIRVIIRPTQTYSKILQNSFHPQVIIEKQDFRSYLQKNIKKSSFLKDVIRFPLSPCKIFW